MSRRNQTACSPFLFLLRVQDGKVLQDLEALLNNKSKTFTSFLRRFKLLFFTPTAHTTAVLDVRLKNNNNLKYERETTSPAEVMFAQHLDEDKIKQPVVYSLLWVFGEYY